MQAVPLPLSTRRIYRPETQAIAFLFDHVGELEVDTSCCSL